MATKSVVPIRLLLALWLFVLSAVSFLDRTNISIAGPQIIRSYGISNQRLGWIFSAFLIGYAGCQIPAGWLVAKYGPRLVLTVSVVSWGVITALTTIVPMTSAALSIFLILRLILGASEAAMYPGANQFVARWIPLGERGRINGLIFAGVGAGSGLTPPLLVWLIAHHGWRSAFWFSAIAGAVAGAIWWFAARDTPEQHPLVSESELALITQQQAKLPDDIQLDPKPWWAGETQISWRSIMSSRDLPALMLSYFSFCYIAWIFFSWFFIYMAQARGFDIKSSARFTMLPFLSMTVCCLAGGALSDIFSRKFGLRAGRCLLAATASVFTGVFLVLGSQVHNPAFGGIILAGGAGMLYIGQSSYWSVSIEIAGNRSGIYSSIINMSGQIGGAVTASLTPWVAKRYGWSSSFGVAAALAGVSAVCWLLVRPERNLSVGN
jgi:ACS family glucarate transporter-like MFS transporter